MGRTKLAQHNLTTILNTSHGNIRKTVRNLVTDLYDAGVVTFSEQPIKLNSGALSHIYVNGRNDITENPHLLATLARMIACQAKKKMPRGTPRILFLGAPTAGTPLAVAAGLLGDGTGFQMGSRMVRSKPKGHGAHRKWIDGAYDGAEFYVMVDNAISSGTTLRGQIGNLAKSGYNIKELYYLILIDREQGGIEALRKAGYMIDSLLDLSDICKAFGVLGFWSKEKVKAACDELVALRQAA